MKIEKLSERGLADGRVVFYYRAGEVPNDWDMEVVLAEDGTPDMTSDANVQYALEAAKVWKAWAKFAKKKNKEGWL